MNIVIYDFEVFRYDWLVVFKDYTTKLYTMIHNDNEALKACINDETIYVGFNSKFYDQHIVRGICLDYDNAEVKALNDYLIHGGQGWQYPGFQNSFFHFNNVDVMDDMQKGLSLKAIEGHLGMNIKESEVDFNLDRPLTEEELKQTIFYCRHDVDATEQVFELRKGYFKNKIFLGKLSGLDEVKAMGMTNAKLTAAMLKASPKKYNDEREYKYPDNLKKEFIPQEVFDYFNRMYDPNLSDDEVFKNKLDLAIGDCKVRIGYGGIHGAIPNFEWREDAS